VAGSPGSQCITLAQQRSTIWRSLLQSSAHYPYPDPLPQGLRQAGDKFTRPTLIRSEPQPNLKAILLVLSQMGPLTGCVRHHQRSATSGLPLQHRISMNYSRKTNRAHPTRKQAALPDPCQQINWLAARYRTWLNSARGLHYSGTGGGFRSTNF
jgi:hypothetical protein